MTRVSFPKRVRKRDGFEVSFDPETLRRSLRAALEGDDEDRFALQLAEVAALYAGRGADGVTTTRDLSAACELALEGHGCAPAARRYRRHRDRSEAVLRELRVHADGRVAPWDRQRLCRSLLRDRHVETLVARTIARAVERHVAALGLKHVTGDLVAALADAECRQRGLGGRPVGSSGLEPDRSGLRAWLGSGTLPIGRVGAAERAVALLHPEADLRAQLGGRLLAAFAVEEVLPAGAARAFAAGRIDFVALDDWLRPLALHLGVERHEAAAQVLDRLAEARAHEVSLYVPADWRPPDPELVPALDRLGGAALRVTTADFARAAAWRGTGRVLGFPLGAYLDLDPETRGAAVTEADVLQWQAPNLPLPPGGEGRRAVLDGAAVVNLPLLAREAGAWCEGDFLDALREALDAACRGLAALARRRSGAAAGRDDGSGALPPAVQLLPAGLERAAAILYPDPNLLRGHLRRFLLTLRDLFERAPARAGLRTRHGLPPRAGSVGARLAAHLDDPRVVALPVGWTPADGGGGWAEAALGAAPWLSLRPAQVRSGPWARALTAARARRSAGRLRAVHDRRTEDAPPSH